MSEEAKQYRPEEGTIITTISQVPDGWEWRNEPGCDFWMRHKSDSGIDYLVECRPRTESVRWSKALGRTTIGGEKIVAVASNLIDGNWYTTETRTVMLGEEENVIVRMEQS